MKHTYIDNTYTHTCTQGQLGCHQMRGAFSQKFYFLVFDISFEDPDLRRGSVFRVGESILIFTIRLCGLNARCFHSVSILCSSNPCLCTVITFIPQSSSSAASNVFNNAPPPPSSPLPPLPPLPGLLYSLLPSSTRNLRGNMPTE